MLAALLVHLAFMTTTVHAESASPHAQLRAPRAAFAAAEHLSGGSAPPFNEGGGHQPATRDHCEIRAVPARTNAAYEPLPVLCIALPPPYVQPLSSSLLTASPPGQSSSALPRGPERAFLQVFLN